MKHTRKWLFIIVLIVMIIGGGYFYMNESGSHQLRTATSRPPRVKKKTVHLVALGDSLTYGQGDEKDNGGYVGQIQPKLENHFHNKVTTVNYGVSGDRSDQILRRLNNQSAIRDDLKNADVIVMTVGGNDLMQTLQQDVLSNSTSGVNNDVDKAGVTYTNKLHKLFSAVRTQNKKAPIFVFSIYNPVYTYFPQVDVINNSIANWNRITKKVVAGEEPAYFVDINHLMSYGQYKTSDERQKLVNQSKKDNQDSVSQRQVIQIMNHKNNNLNEYITTEDNFHPNNLGYRKMTDKLYQSMLKHDNFEYKK